jgi:hypothetical protein
MANSPFGGMIWQAYHYLVPLRKLGFDVWYVEDTDYYSFDPVSYMPTWEPEANVRLLAQFMEDIGQPDRWFVRKPNQEECFGGKNYSALLKLYREADGALNLCGAQEPRECHELIRCRVYVETDPVKNQVHVANGEQWFIDMLAHNDHLFTYGENLGNDDCRVPIERFQWKTTRPPVVNEWWATDRAPAKNSVLTSVANWKHKGKDVEWNGETWRWSKHHEFLKFIGLPRTAALPMELSVGAISKEDRKSLLKNGWRVRPSNRLEAPEAYRQYIRESLGEFTVAKEQYVAPRSGWFSDRSVCYLAAGRPVVTQDTAFGKRIPTGEGLFSYSDRDGALAAIEAIASDYARHSKAAAEIAREYFDADKVVADLLSQAGLL